MFGFFGSFDTLFDDSFKGTNTHAALSVAGESIVSSEAVSTLAWIGLNSAMNFGVSFEIVLADKTLLAVTTLELSISKVRLDVGFDIFFPSETFLAVGIQT